MRTTRSLHFDNPKIAKLYKRVPQEQVQELLQFRAEYPYRHTTVNGVPWAYIAAGQGPQAVVVLTGALAVGESPASHIVRFAPQYRVISPDYAPAPTMAELADGIAGILAEEGIGKAHVVGGSYGGMVAQILVRRHPELIDRLVLSHTGPPGARRGVRHVRALRLMRWLPTFAIRSLFLKALSALSPGDVPQLEFLIAFSTEIIRFRLTRSQLIAGFERTVDYYTNYTFTPHDLADWPGRVLLLMADDDPATPEPVREAMMQLYPDAQVHMFHGTGHAAAILKQDEYLSTIEAFIAQRS